MCGRFTQHYTWGEVRDFLDVFGPPRNLQPRYNIAPTTEIDVIRRDKAGQREFVRMRWGLVPFFWKKTLRELPPTFNARAETVGEKPMFREALRRRRCLIPASGFYEWTNEADGKQPHLFTAADGSPLLAFAGLWDFWRDPATGEDVLSATIIVSGASQWMERYHDRMPVLLTRDQFEDWLGGSEPASLLKPASEAALREHPVDRRMNRTAIGDDDPTLVAAIA